MWRTCERPYRFRKPLIWFRLMQDRRKQKVTMRTGRGAGPGLVAVVVMMLAAAPAGAQSEREALEQQLKEQQARNESLRQRIEKIEAILKTDVCADPQAAELVLEETEAPEPVDSPAR